MKRVLMDLFGSNEFEGTQILRSAEDVGMAVLLFSKYKARDGLW